jgi:hypothetical protein
MTPTMDRAYVSNPEGYMGYTAKHFLTLFR